MFNPKVLGLIRIPDNNNKIEIGKLNLFDNKITELPITNIMKKSTKI
jgi:hypothetical protein